MSDTALYCSMYDTPQPQFSIPPISEQDKVITTVSTLREAMTNGAKILLQNAEELN